MEHKLDYKKLKSSIEIECKMLLNSGVPQEIVDDIRKKLEKAVRVQTADEIIKQIK